MSGVVDALDVHRELLKKWRKAMDLVGPGPIEPHFQDADGAVGGLPVAGLWADLGSGAGFPGIALAHHYRNAQVQLVESRQKRAIFLRKVLAQAKLEHTSVFHGRTEALPSQAYDGVISRAYKPPERFLEDADRLLKPDGIAVLLLGDQGGFSLPPAWRICSSLRYPVGDGHRVRMVVARSQH